jgi:predicted ATPase
MTQRYILTGAPGAGKTTLLRLLQARGYPVVEEAATEVIARRQAAGDAEPWLKADFIDLIVELQRERQLAADGAVQFFDRSPICTLALAKWLEREPSEVLRHELARIEELYERRVMFVQNIGFSTPTAARRISFEDSLKFEALHAEVYDSLGYECVMIAPGEPEQRVDAILAAIG